VIIVKDGLKTIEDLKFILGRLMRTNARLMLKSLKKR
jgi:hypothetical protein